MFYKCILGCCVIGCLIMSYLLGIGMQKPKGVLIINMENEAILPRHFHTTKDSFKHSPNLSVIPSREGLDNLPISGSAQFSEKSLALILKTLKNPTNLSIVDLRQESHGFLDGMAISWYLPRNWINIGQSLQKIELLENNLLKNLSNQNHVTIHKIVKKDAEGHQTPETTHTTVKVQFVLSEKQLVEQFGINYLRIPIADHTRPTDEIVDQFIQFVRGLPQNHWLHFHCSAGVGRTTTFMIMYDMMKNAKTVKFDDIINRQWLIGGANMRKTTLKYTWKTPYAEERVKFLQHFYDYCKDNQDDFKQSWSSFIKK